MARREGGVLDGLDRIHVKLLQSGRGPELPAVLDGGDLLEGLPLSLSVAN